MRLLFSFILIFSILVGSGQDVEMNYSPKTDSTPSSLDNGYIQKFNNKLILKGYIQNKSNEFELSNRQNDVISRFEPNGVSSFGVGFNYKALGLSIGILPLGKKDNTKYGKTRKLDIQGNFFTKKVGFDVHFQYYQGFFLANITSIDPSYNTDSIYPIRSDIATFALGGSVFYIFNHDKFSFKSLYTNNEWQKKSAGTFFAGLKYDIFAVIADSAISPESPSYRPDSSEYFNGASYVSFGIYGGYAYNLVIEKHGFISIGLGPGLGRLKVNLIDFEGKSIPTKPRAALSLNFQFGAGFNSEKHFGGIQVNQNTAGFQYNQGEGRFNINSGSFKIYYGYRFL